MKQKVNLVNNKKFYKTKSKISFTQLKNVPFETF